MFRARLKVSFGFKFSSTYIFFTYNASNSLLEGWLPIVSSMVIRKKRKSLSWPFEFPLLCSSYGEIFWASASTVSTSVLLGYWDDIYKIVLDAFALLVLPEVLKYWHFLSWSAWFLNGHPSMSFSIACSYMSLPPSLFIFFSALQDFCCCLFSFSTVLLITCLAHQGWGRDTTEGALRLWRIIMARGCVGYSELQGALQSSAGWENTEPRMVLCQKVLHGLAMASGMAIVQHGWFELLFLREGPE